MAAGFVGGSFAKNTDNVDSSVDFGGQVGWLWHGIVGAEFLADFAPRFRFTNLDIIPVFNSRPAVNAYMANGIAAYPLGSQGQFQPYASAGIGAITIRADVLLLNPDLTTFTANSNQSQFGSNYGGGFLWYVGNIGIRGDIRYFRTSTNNSINTTNVADFIAQSAISDLKFWRANGGLAVRW